MEHEPKWNWGKNKRNNFIVLRVDFETFQSIKNKAKELNLSVSKYLRNTFNIEQETQGQPKENQDENGYNKPSVIKNKEI